LSRVKVYESDDEQRAADENAVFAFLINVSHKRRIFEVFLDAFLITLAYYTSFAMLRMFEYESNWPLFLKTLPLLILVKLAALLIVGVYRGLWRHTSIGDLITITKGVLLGSVLSIFVVLLVHRFEGFSRTVFFLDGVLLLLLIVGSRLAFRVIRQMLPAPLADGGRKVLIYGAGDGGEMLLRELNNNPDWNSVAVGFIDDDAQKVDKVMHGLRVYDGSGPLNELCAEKNVEEIIVAIRNITPERLKRLREECRGTDVTLRRAAIKIEPLDTI
jgi:UDP-GlcNAc:undecaprenyl-phosphate GlcNAc-1-phosphate transferase